MEIDVDGTMYEDFAKHEDSPVELPITYEKDDDEDEIMDSNSMPLVYDDNVLNTCSSMPRDFLGPDKRKSEHLTITYEKDKNTVEDLTADKLFTPTLQAIADLPSDSLLTLVTIIAEEDAANTLPLTYAQRNDIMDIPEEGENITYIEKNTEHLNEDENAAYGENIVLQLV